MFVPFLLLLDEGQDINAHGSGAPAQRIAKQRGEIEVTIKVEVQTVEVTYEPVP